MKRGTTPSVAINVNGVDISDMVDIYITFKQGGYEVVKTTTDIIIEDTFLVVKLTQEETLGFSASKSIKIQLRAVMNNGEVVASDIKYVNIDDILQEEVI